MLFVNSVVAFQQQQQHALQQVSFASGSSIVVVDDDDYDVAPELPSQYVHVIVVMPPCQLHYHYY